MNKSYQTMDLDLKSDGSTVIICESANGEALRFFGVIDRVCVFVYMPTHAQPPNEDLLYAHVW